MSDEMLALLSVWSEVQMICIWSSWCHCHLIISCFIKIHIGLLCLVPAYPGCPGKEAVKQVSSFQLMTFIKTCEICLHFVTIYVSTLWVKKTVPNLFFAKTLSTRLSAMLVFKILSL